MNAATALRIAHAAVLALIAVELLWETWLAPLRPGGSWLALKAVPLVVVLPWLLRGARNARTVTALLLLLYVTEGIVRASSEHGRTAWIAASAGALGLIAFLALFAADRALRRDVAQAAARRKS